MKSTLERKHEKTSGDQLYFFRHLKCSGKQNSPIKVVKGKNNCSELSAPASSNVFLITAAAPRCSAAPRRYEMHIAAVTDNSIFFFFFLFPHEIADAASSA